MKVVNLLPADKYIVVNKTILTEIDKKKKHHFINYCSYYCIICCYYAKDTISET